MRWWTRTLRPLWAIGAAVVGTAAVIGLPDAFGLPIPSLAGPTPFATVRSFALAAVLITVCLWVSVSAGHKSAVLAATRAIQLHGLGFLCTIVGTCGVLVGAWSVVRGAPSMPGVLLLRDVLGLLGLGMLLTRWTGYRFAGIVSTAYVFVSAIFGRTESGESAVWAWPISASTRVELWIPAVTLFSIGTVAWLWRARGQYSPVMIRQAMDSRRE